MLFFGPLRLETGLRPAGPADPEDGLGLPGGPRGQAPWRTPGTGYRLFAWRCLCFGKKHWEERGG